MFVDRFATLASVFVAASSAAFAAAPQHSSNKVAPAARGPSTVAQKALDRAQFLAGVEARFNLIDTDHDGTLDPSEIAAAQQKYVDKALALEKQRLEAEFARLDTNHDGQLTKAEFMAAFTPVHSRQTPQQIIAALDTNGDGKISLEEYEAGPLAKFNRLDADHDGILSPKEIQSAPAAGKRP